MKRYVALNREPTASEALEVERRRLADGIDDDERILGNTVQSYYVRCHADAPDVLARALEIMRIVNAHGLAGAWPSHDQWQNLLPEWFVDACAPEQTHEEYERALVKWRAMTHEQRMECARTEKWQLSEFTSWMAPSGRLDPGEAANWIWFDAEVRDENTILVHDDEAGDSQGTEPPGLRWLFRACGALDMDDVDDPDDMIGVKPA